MTTNALGAMKVTRKTGEEPFLAGGQPAGFDLRQFWQWACSDLANNAMRGVLAEYVVAQALGVAGGTRAEWDAYDVKTASGLKVEVKSAAYLQSWHQTKLSAIAFNICPTVGWDAETNTYATRRCRQADVYVFALLAHQDKATLDPLDLDQWQFYVLPTARLDEAVPEQKMISLGGLLRLEPAEASWRELPGCIEALSARR